MASEKLVIELWEIVQKENNEKISYDVFENDLNDALNLPRDEVDRALALMLSQAEVNPNLIGEYKGGSFVISSSFAATITTTIKYENQFIPGTKEYDVRKNAKDNREFIDIAGVLLVGSVVDKMIDNFQELSTKERDALLNNITSLSLEQRIKMNSITIDMIRNARMRDTAGLVKKQLDFAEQVAQEAKEMQEALKSGDEGSLRSAYGKTDIPAEQISTDNFVDFIIGTNGKNNPTYTQDEFIAMSGRIEGNPVFQNDNFEVINPGINKDAMLQNKHFLLKVLSKKNKDGMVISLDNLTTNNDKKRMEISQLKEMIIQVTDNVYMVNNKGTYQFVTIDGATLSTENIKQHMTSVREVLKDILPPEQLREYLELYEQSRTSLAAKVVHDATRALDIKEAVEKKDVREVGRLIKDSSVGKALQKFFKLQNPEEVADKLIQGEITSENIQQMANRVIEDFQDETVAKFGFSVNALSSNAVSLSFTERAPISEVGTQVAKNGLEEKYLKEIIEVKKQIDLIGSTEDKTNAFKLYRTLLESINERMEKGEISDTAEILEYIKVER